ncbi:hypothetical protein PR003_g2427 [Phytophthora rubi]|uniref:Uncharacterized protein n=1 Tax=Phytophthora rubi TaxID=129364 RepID=A0A6A4G8C5_9STRA|nr:hypothetical protein PR001_g2235 [Phytophthora rubi]KAE9356231.1 hypothetical protein PR003_g2427 [Phytophthora rubi]
MFAPPTTTSPAQLSLGKKRQAPSPASSTRPVTRQKTAAATGTQDAERADELDDAAASDLTDPPLIADDDVLALLHQHRPLGGAASGLVDDSLARYEDGNDNRGRSASTFRPSILQQQFYKVIGQPHPPGTEPQTVLEYAQQVDETCFRRTPPVLRGAYDFGFHDRGLSVMHFAQFTPTMMLELSSSTVNMTDFSRKIFLHPCPSSPSYTEFIEALYNLKAFGRTFYNTATTDVLDAAARFIEKFREAGVPDRDTTHRLILWIDMKLGKFRGLVLSKELADAVKIKLRVRSSRPFPVKTSPGPPAGPNRRLVGSARIRFQAGKKWQ